MDEAMFRGGLINSLIHAHALKHGKDGLIYEDDVITVTCTNGEYIMAGKPIREPLMYITVRGIE